MQAFYDNKPSKLQAVGNGSYLYHWDIEEVEFQTNDEFTVSVKQWKCNEAIVWAPLSPNKITEAVIKELWDVNYEQKLLNEYNAANLGVYDEINTEKKITAYKDFLIKRNTIKEQVDQDCRELGIK